MLNGVGSTTADLEGDPMSEKTASQVRDNFGDTIDAVRHRGERVIITKSGKPAAAMVSTEDLALLELLEDRIDLEMVREARAESAERIPFAKIRAELNL